MPTATTGSTRSKDTHDAPRAAAATGEHAIPNEQHPRPAPLTEPEPDLDDAYDNIACTD
ncbi:MAG: hypothetical protein ACRELB_06095 [Polyangiaceae bacterium]